MISFTREQLFLVTGASSGIGKATAQQLVAAGASVVALGRNKQRLSEAREGSVAPDAFHTHNCDLADSLDSLAPLVKELRTSYGKFSGMVSCAGHMYMDGLQSYSTHDTDMAFRIHFHVPILLIKALTDRRNCIGSGTSLVLISALGGVEPQQGLLSYGAIKAALIFAAKNLSKELGRRKIRLNTISPALVRTAMTEGQYTEFMGYDVLSAEEPNFPLGIGEPSDVAGAAAFLLSSQSRWITGQNAILEGGRY